MLKKLLNDSKISYVVNGKQIILKPLQISSNTKLETINEVAQKISVTGIIVDKSGEPLPGASIIEKGTSNGTETDFNGNFSLYVNKGAILVVQYLGYAKKEVTVKDKTNLKIVLIEDTSSLDEIVVIGYGSLSRSKVLGAVSSVNAEDISQLPVSSLDDAIAGRVAGVQVVSNGAPGAGSTINIRGRHINCWWFSFNSCRWVSFIRRSRLNDINPNDIASFVVLKDAASAAIYGSRGANGVIIISTKKAKTDKVTFNFNTYSGFQEVLNESNDPRFKKLLKKLEIGAMFPQILRIEILLIAMLQDYLKELFQDI